jgi:hypothetical protein
MIAHDGFAERALTPIALQLSPPQAGGTPRKQVRVVAEEVFMTGIRRHKLLAGAGGSALAVKLRGWPASSLRRRRLLSAQGATLQWLRVNDVVPA